MNKENTYQNEGQPVLKEMEFDEQVSKKMQEELAQLTVSEELIQKTLLRIDEKKTEGGAKERAVRRLVRKRRVLWSGLVAAASVALLVITIRFTGGVGQNKSSGDMMMAPVAAGSQNNQEALTDAIEAPDFSPGFVEDIFKGDTITSETENSISDSDSCLEGNEPEYGKEWKDETLETTDNSCQCEINPAMLLEDYALLGTIMQDGYEVPEEIDGYQRVSYEGDTGIVTCFVNEENEILIYIQVQDEIRYSTTGDARCADWLRAPEEP